MIPKTSLFSLRMLGLVAASAVVSAASAAPGAPSMPSSIQIQPGPRALNPQPIPPGRGLTAALNPQPIPPGRIDSTGQTATAAGKPVFTTARINPVPIR